MSCRLVVRSRVLVRRAITTADVTTVEAEAQMEPLGSGQETVRAAAGAGWNDLPSGVEMVAGGRVDHVNRAMSASAAQDRKWVAPQTGSVPSMKLSSANPNTSIVIPHGDSFTPISTARSRSSPIEATP